MPGLGKKILQTILLAKSGQGGNLLEQQAQLAAQMQALEREEEMRRAIAKLRAKQDQRLERVKGRQGRKDAAAEEERDLDRLRDKARAQFPGAVRRGRLDPATATRGELEGFAARRASRGKGGGGPAKKIQREIADLVLEGAPSSLLDRAAGEKDRGALRGILREAQAAVGELEAEKKRADIGKSDRSNRPKGLSKKPAAPVLTFKTFREEIAREAANQAAMNGQDPREDGVSVEDRTAATDEVVRRLTGKRLAHFSFGSEQELYARLIEELQSGESREGLGPDDPVVGNAAATARAIARARQRAGIGGE